MTADLALDAGFGQNGVSLLAQTGFSRGLVEQPNGRYVLGFSNSSQFGLARLNPDGSLDSTYGSGGMVFTSLINNFGGIATCSKIGKPVVRKREHDSTFRTAWALFPAVLGRPGSNESTSTFAKGPDQSLPQNAGAQTVAGWATAISDGAGDEGQTLNFVVQSTNPGLFAIAPSITPSGTLSYTPAAGVSGAALVTVTLHNSGGTAGGGSDTSAAQTFNINVGPFSPWQNPIQADDANDDGIVSPLDALVIIDEINARGVHSLDLPANPPSGPAIYFDVNGDGVVSPLDALLVIDDLNAQISQGQGTVAEQARVPQAAASQATAGIAQPAATVAIVPLSAVAFTLQTSATTTPAISTSVPNATALPGTSPSASKPSDAPAADTGAVSGSSSLNVAFRTRNLVARTQSDDQLERQTPGD